jgi:signal transduction histidine kinase
VEDSEDDAALLERALVRSGWAPVTRRVQTEEELRTALAIGGFDLIISDWVLPSFSGMSALGVVRSVAPEVPVLICSGKIDEEVAVAALRAGARDFVTKGNLARLGPAVDRELEDVKARAEQRRAEQDLQALRAELVRARRLEEAGMIASQVAHDLKNLIQPLILGVELVQRRVGRDHPAREPCERLATGVRRLSGVIEDSLTLGRRAQARLEPTDLNNVLLDVLDGLPDPPESLRVQIDLDPGLPPVNGAPMQLARALTNLVTNAREAMNDSGTLVVRTRTTQVMAPTAAGATLQARIEVSDTGCGIAPEQLCQIFRPFFTTKSGGVRGGSGLGLAIVDAIVGDHQGKVDVASEVGRGTTFTISIPAAVTPSA